jgi:hypothetical protein
MTGKMIRLIEGLLIAQFIMLGIHFAIMPCPNMWVLFIPLIALGVLLFVFVGWIVVMVIALGGVGNYLNRRNTR